MSIAREVPMELCKEFLLRPLTANEIDDAQYHIFTDIFIGFNHYTVPVLAKPALFAVVLLKSLSGNAAPPKKVKCNNRGIFLRIRTAAKKRNRQQDKKRIIDRIFHIDLQLFYSLVEYNVRLV